MHYARLRRTGKVGGVDPKHVKNRICLVVGCNRPHEGKGFCGMHLWRFRNHGSPGQAGSKRTGNGYITKDGYHVVYKHGHPNARHDGSVLEHILVMSQHLGRALRKEEKVHHKNGIRHENEFLNLELWVKGHCSGQRVSDRITDAISFLYRYAPDQLVWPVGSEMVRQFLLKVSTP